MDSFLYSDTLSFCHYNECFLWLLKGEKAHFLNIGPKTGIIKLAQPVDRETNEQIRVTIVATDSGTPPLSGSTVLKVFIKDANDNPPTFTNLAQHQARNPVMIKESKYTNTVYSQVWDLICKD